MKAQKSNETVYGYLKDEMIQCVKEKGEIALITTDILHKGLRCHFFRHFLHIFWIVNRNNI